MCAAQSGDCEGVVIQVELDPIPNKPKCYQGDVVDTSDNPPTLLLVHGAKDMVSFTTKMNNNGSPS